MVIQFVVRSEALALRTTAYTACDEKLFRRHILPNALKGLKISLVASECCHIGHTTVQIACTHGMTYYLLLLQDRHMVLRILRRMMTIGTTTCLIHEILGTFQIFLVACYLIQLAERHLDDRMSTRTMNLTLVRSEGLANQVGIFDSHIQECLLACSTIVGNGTLDEVTRVVEFVRVNLLPLVCAPPSAQARTFISNTRSKIAIGLLSLGDDVNH